MKLIIILLVFLSKFSVKTTATIGGILIVDHFNAQSYTSGGNTGFNSWSVYQVNSPTNTYGNRYNCVNINRDSIVLRTKYIMMDSISNNNFSVDPNGKFAWLDGRQMKISKLDSMPLSLRQVTVGLGFMPSVSGSGVTSFNSRTGSVSLTNTDVDNALGYTPYSSLNPNGYISNINSGMVISALGYTPLQTEIDGNTSNEIQTLSLASGSLNLSLNGGSVAVSSIPLTASQITTGLGYVPGTSNSTLTSITASTGISVTNGSVITNTSPDQIVSISAGNTNIDVSGTYPSFVLTPYIPTTFTVSRAINSATFQPSATKMAWVYYTIRINCTATIGSASSGTVNLQYSTNNGSTWVDVGQVENSNTVSLAIVLNSNTTQTGQLSGVIPAGAIVRMNQSSSGTTTITYVRGNETY